MVQDTKLASDGLPAIGQGPWSRDKLHFVSRFAEMFSTGMKNRWHTRLYVDLFAGPGLCLDKTTGEEFEGSPMLALGCKTPFTHLYLNDQNHDFVNALKQRQEAKFPDSQVSYYGLDCNEAASAIYRSLPSGALVLCFIDPWTYEVTFDSLAALCQHRSIDLIVTFHSTAIKRNAHHEIHSTAIKRNGSGQVSRRRDLEGGILCCRGRPVATAHPHSNRDLHGKSPEAPGVHTLRGARGDPEHQ